MHYYIYSYNQIYLHYSYNQLFYFFIILGFQEIWKNSGILISTYYKFNVQLHDQIFKKDLYFTYYTLYIIKIKILPFRRDLKVKFSFTRAINSNYLQKFKRILQFFNNLFIYVHKAWKKSSMKKIFQTENFTKVMNLNFEILNIDEEFSVHPKVKEKRERIWFDKKWNNTRIKN